MPEDPNAFADPARLRGVLDGVGRPWWIAGGWAIDLFVGRITRSHKDVDVAIARWDQLPFQQHLASAWLLKVAPGDGSLVPWESGLFLELPIHEVWCQRRETAALPQRIELLLNEIDDTTFRFRRDRLLELPLAEMGLMCHGLPVLAPQIVLLYKAKYHGNPEEEHDFRIALSVLSSAQRQWLSAGLHRLHPGHPWLAAL